MGCLGSSIKFILFATNFIIFILSGAVFGVGIWALVDAPSFLDLFKLAQDALANNGVEVGGMELNIYSTAAYILIATAAVAAVLSFLGCCGAAKGSKCMLGTYFILMLIIFIVAIVGAVWGYKGDIETEIRDPLLKAIEKYKDVPFTDVEKAYHNAWNNAQGEFLCCGVYNVTDWKAVKDFPPGLTQPEGCCRVGRDGHQLTEAEIKTCRGSTDGPNSNSFYFRGCWTIFVEKIDNNINIVVGVAIGVIVLMFVNMLLSFGMCMMVD